MIGLMHLLPGLAGLSRRHLLCKSIMTVAYVALLTSKQMVASVIQGLIVLNNLETYTFHAWHGTLLTIGVILFASIFNTLLATRLPLVEGTLLILHLAGLFAIIIPLWVMYVDWKI